MNSPRQRFLDYVRRRPGARPVVSPFLPKPELMSATLQALGLTAEEDAVANEIRLAQALDYEPMFYAPCLQFLFPWQKVQDGADPEASLWVLPTPQGEWVRRVDHTEQLYSDESNFPIQTEADHAKLVAACEQVGERADDIRSYYRAWRQQVGEGGVIIIGHPHVPWLCEQIGPQTMVFHAVDYPETFVRSMEAICEAAIFVFEIALEEGIDFMSESSYGLEMISPRQFAAQDVVYTRRLADWTHDHGGLFWYHNCGKTRDLIRSGLFNRLGADVIETLAPPPEGDNDLAESRRHLSRAICSKGNLSLGLLRDGTVKEVTQATREMVRAVKEYAHIHSTADAVYGETPVENFVAFLETAREASND